MTGRARSDWSAAESSLTGWTLARIDRRTEGLGADRCEHLQLVVALGAGDGGVDHQAVSLVRVQECLAVQLEPADLGVLVALHLMGVDADLVHLPQEAELLAPLQQAVGQLRRS